MRRRASMLTVPLPAPPRPLRPAPAQAGLGANAGTEAEAFTAWERRRKRGRSWRARGNGREKGKGVEGNIRGKERDTDCIAPYLNFLALSSAVSARLARQCLPLLSCGAVRRQRRAAELHAWPPGQQLLSRRVLPAALSCGRRRRHSRPSPPSAPPSPPSPGAAASWPTGPAAAARPLRRPRRLHDEPPRRLPGHARRQSGLRGGSRRPRRRLPSQRCGRAASDDPERSSGGQPAELEHRCAPTEGSRTCGPFDRFRSFRDHVSACQGHEAAFKVTARQVFRPQSSVVPRGHRPHV